MDNSTDEEALKPHASVQDCTKELQKHLASFTCKKRVSNTSRRRVSRLNSLVTLSTDNNDNAESVG